MTSMSNGTKLLATMAALGATLSGCDSIKDVRDEPFTELPAQTVVLEGTITGLGSRRSVVLMNNGDAARAMSFLAPIVWKLESHPAIKGNPLYGYRT
jgi:hypothetical protein